MRFRSLLCLVVGAFSCAISAGQTPTPPPPSLSPTPGPVMPPGYACQDPDNGVWVPEGGSRTKTTTSPLDPLLPTTGGTQTVTEVYICHSGSWRLWQRTTTWSKATGMALYPPGYISESGTRKERFDISTGCRTWKDEMIGRRTKTQAGLSSPILQDDRCIWTTDSTDCGNPESASHSNIERWVQTKWYFGGTWDYANAGYTESVDNVGYDQAGNLIEDFHSNYLRRKAGSDGLYPVGTGQASFQVSYYETGETVPHPMSYYANYLIGGGPSGGNVWSGAAQIPQYDAVGNFLSYASQTIGQILGRAKSHEYLLCGSDDGSGWPWAYPGFPMP